MRILRASKNVREKIFKEHMDDNLLRYFINNSYHQPLQDETYSFLLFLLVNHTKIYENVIKRIYEDDKDLFEYAISRKTPFGWSTFMATFIHSVKFSNFLLNNLSSKMLRKLMKSTLCNYGSVLIIILTHNCSLMNVALENCEEDIIKEQLEHI